MSTSPYPATKRWTDEFVVDLDDRRMVVDELRNLLPSIDLNVDESKVLNLALITLNGPVDEVAKQIRALDDFQAREDEDAVDTIIRAIRERGKAKYGHEPLMGKNRLLDGVHTAQHVGTGGAAGYPAIAFSSDVRGLSTNGAADRVQVGVVDTALWPHPKLEGRYRANEPDILLAAAEQQPDTVGHATFVAGMILQHSPNVELVVRRALDSDGTALAWNVAEEMVTLADSVDVLNVSFACFTDDEEEPLLMKRVVDLIYQNGRTVMVAAAGNFGDIKPGTGGRTPPSPTSKMWPAASERVTAVGAHDFNDQRAGFSPNATWVDLTALGVNVPSLYLQSLVSFQTYEGVPYPGPMTFRGYARWTGTSFAAGLASGAIARRIRKGTKVVNPRKALDEVLDLPRKSRDNKEHVWRFKATL